MSIHQDLKRIGLKDGSSLRTTTGKPFVISRISDTAIYIDLPSGAQTVSIKNLEKAKSIVMDGGTINGPKEYREKVKDERPAYAWAILDQLTRHNR